MNSIIQGSAADLIKIAMIRLDSEPTLEQMGVQMLMQVHDELVFEMDREVEEEASPLVREIMEHPLDGPLLVETPVDMSVVDRWSSAK